MHALYAPHPDTHRIAETDRSDDGVFHLDDDDLAAHLLRFGWTTDRPEWHLEAERRATPVVIVQAPAPADENAVTPNLDTDPTHPLPNLKDMRKADLIALADARGVSSEGTADDIKARLRVLASTS